MADYTTIDDPSAYFQNLLWTGNNTDGTALTFDGNSDMQPDFVWVKHRNGTGYHGLFDSVRGVTKRLHTNTTGAEGTVAESLQSFNSNGFTVGNNSEINGNSKTYVGWNWKAGTSVSGNTTGSGTAKSYSGSVNTDASFSITTFTGNSTANHTLPHNLGVAPDWFIIKKRIGTGDSTARDWNVYHKSLGNTKRIALNKVNGVSTSNEYWNNISPTSSVINLGTNDQINGNNNTYICYAFAEKQGYSKFSSYKGNGNANAPFVYTGFSPAFLMIKQTAASNDWFMIDNKREPFNPNNVQLVANGTSASTNKGDLDLLSNGFKPRSSNAAWNENNAEYIYMAFAENPFVSSSGVPANAR